MSDRVSERRRAAVLALHYREEENLTIAEIARRLGRAEATVKAYLYDPSGEKARAVKRRYQGVCRGCGAPTTARNGKGDAHEYCKRCHPGAIAPTRTREWVRDAMREWRRRYGRPPSSTDWSRTHAVRRGGEALKRLRDGDWPPPSTAIDLYGSWAAALADALPDKSSVEKGGFAGLPGTYVAGWHSSPLSAPTLATAAESVRTAGTSSRSRTPPSCSSASAASAPACRAYAS